MQTNVNKKKKLINKLLTCMNSSNKWGNCFRSLRERISLKSTALALNKKKILKSDFQSFFYVKGRGMLNFGFSPLFMEVSLLKK